MTLRSQTLALIVLFVGLAVVFVLVGTGDLNTDVFTTAPTATGTATPEPTPVPVEELWTEQAPGQLLYAPDPEAQAAIVYETMPPATFAQQLAINPPADDAAYPLLDMLSQIRASLAQQAAEQNITLEDGDLIGPYVEEVNGVGVAFFRAVVGPQTVEGGGEFPGLDIEWALVERPDGDVTMMRYGLQGESKPTIYADYRAWLAANVADLVAPAEAAGEETPALADEETATPAVETPIPPAEVAPEATPASTEEAAAEAVDATPAPEAAQPVEAEPEPVESTEVVPDEEEPTALAQQGPWVVLGPGQLRHEDNANAFLFYNVATLEEFVAQAGAEPLTDDDPTPLLTLLEFMQGEIEGQLAERGITFGEDSFEGPEVQEYGGVPVAFMWIVIEPQTVEGQAVEGQELAIALIDRGDGTVGVVEFVYSGPDDQGIDQAVRDWLDANAARLADPDQPLPELESLNAEEAAPSDATPAAEGAAGDEAGD